MRVIEYEAHNVLRAKDVKLDMEGRHLFLVGGRNDQGKTSALTALQMALCGKSGMDYPEVCLREGESEGWVKVELEGDQRRERLSVELYLKRKRNGQVVESFRVLNDIGEEVREPRSLLKALYQVRGFDPLGFERLGKSEKQQMLRKLLGLDFAASQREYKEAFDERTAINRSLKACQARLDSMPEHKEVPELPVSVASLLAELDVRQKVNRGIAAEKDRLASYARQRDVLGERIQRAAEEVERLKDALAQARAKEADAREAAKTVDAAITKQQELVDSMVPADEADIRTQLSQVEGLNKRISENQERRKIADEAKRLSRAAEDLTNRLEQIKDDQQKAISSAKWPIEGLGFDEEGVTYNGLPFEQASKSVRVLTSVRIGMALNPRLRLLICQDGNDLDDESLAALGRFLEESDFQMLVEMVTRSDADEDRCAVVIHDGAIKR